MAWLSQIGLFVMLGLLVSPARITWEHVGLAVATGLVLTYVARPLAVLASADVEQVVLARLDRIVDADPAHLQRVPAQIRAPSEHGDDR